jgi:hypothetical protein
MAQSSAPLQFIALGSSPLVASGPLALMSRAFVFADREGQMSVTSIVAVPPYAQLLDSSD